MEILALPEYSIVIPAWNESLFIVDAINAAKSAMEQQRFIGELIVVDNNSTDDTASKASRAGATVVFEPVNQIARARNTGANAATGAWLIFIDADSAVNASLLTIVLEALAGGKVIGGGSTILPDHKISGFGSNVLSFWNWVSVKTRTAAGCFVYCQRDAFEKVGGFSEKVYAGEELHLSRKLRKLAKQQGKRFVIQTASPIVTSTRKLEWYSPLQMIWQFLLLLLPGATYSKRMCGMWYDRSNIKK